MMNPKFLLVLGVSGVGKSSVIRELLKLDDRFTYISPFITRSLRDSETDKVSVSNDEMDSLIAQGKILVVNNIYGIRYATPRQPIEQAFADAHFPLLDWPINRLDVMKHNFPDRLFTAYLEPPDVAELKRRLGKDDRDKTGKRLLEAIVELEKLSKGRFDDDCDVRVVSNGDVAKVASFIYRAYLHSVQG